MLEREQGKICSRAPRVKGSFLLIFVIGVLRLHDTSKNGRGDISTGAADICVWEVHVWGAAGLSTPADIVEEIKSRLKSTG